MPHIIDGHNLIGRFPGLSLADIDDELDLVRILQQYCRNRRKCQIEVYFDRAPAGSRKTQRFSQITAFFIPVGTTADSAIEMRLHQLGAKARNWTVVSSDRQVMAAAKSFGARVVGSEKFAEEILAALESAKPGSQDKEGELSEAELEEWQRIFQSKLQ